MMQDPRFVALMLKQPIRHKISWLVQIFVPGGTIRESHQRALAERFFHDNN